jgi:hypothetical protein
LLPFPLLLLHLLLSGEAGGWDVVDGRKTGTGGSKSTLLTPGEEGGFSTGNRIVLRSARASSRMSWPTACAEAERLAARALDLVVRSGGLVLGSWSFPWFWSLLQHLGEQDVGLVAATPVAPADISLKGRQ